MMERLLIILDMDETLVHVPEERLPDAGEPEFSVLGDPVYIRPGARELISGLLESHDVAVWTAASHHYGVPIIGQLTDASRLAFLWTRKRCTIARDFDTGGYQLLKPIQKVLRRGRKRTRVLFVDDTPAKIARSYGNYIPVPAWEGDMNDDILLRLLGFIDQLAALEDVRPPEKRGWWRHASQGA